MAGPLMLHSLTFYRDLLERLTALPLCSDLVEIGSESGGTSALLAEWAGRRQGRLHVVEPFPSRALRELAAAHPHVTVVAEYSPEALAGIPNAGAYVIDGDHNFSTVRAELDRVFAPGVPSDTLALLHDVGWPSGRRDQYYDPARMHPRDVRPYSFERGAVLEEELAEPGRGFRGQGAFAWALEEGGRRNGVLGAVEDLLAERPDLAFLSTPLIFGFGVVGFGDGPVWASVAGLMRPYLDNPTLVSIERNRVELLLEVIRLQDKLEGVGLVRHGLRTLLRRVRLRLQRLGLRWRN